MRCIIAFFLTASIGLAECPEAPDFSAEMDVLVQQARAAENDMAGRAVSGQMWELWLHGAGCCGTRGACLRGMAPAQQSTILSGSRWRLHSIDWWSTAPNYAEGYNQRAFVVRF